MVEVFKTNITCADTASAILNELQRYFPLTTISFDLEDCDRILRVKGEGIHSSGIIRVLEGKGFMCEALE